MKKLTTVLFAIAFFACIGAASAAPPVFNGDVVSATLPVYNVKYYGAKCDASTDDSTAIQAAINAAEAAVTGGTAKGGQILIPGICAIASTLTVADGNIALVGNGAAWGENAAYSSGLKWTGSTGGTMVAFLPPNTNTINGGGARNLFFTPSTAKIGIAVTSGQGMTFDGLSTTAFSEAFIEELKPTTGTPSNMHNQFNHISCVDTSGSGSCLWLKYGEYDQVTDLFGGFHNGFLLRLGGGPTADSSQTEDFSFANGIHGINEVSGTGGEVEFDCGSYANDVERTATGASNVARGTATCTGALSASGNPSQNWIHWWDHCDSNGSYPTVETGAGLSTSDDCGNLFMDGPTTDPGRVNGFNYVEFGKSDLPSLTTFKCMLCIGKSNASNPYIVIGNPTATGAYTTLGTSSTSNLCPAYLNPATTGSILYGLDHATADGFCIDGSGRVEFVSTAATNGVMNIVGPYHDFSGGTAGEDATLTLFSTSTAAQDAGAELTLGGQTGNAVPYYAFGGVKCAKQTAAGDANYGGYCAWYTSSTSGNFIQSMKLDDAGVLTLVQSSGYFVAPNGAAASCVGGYTFANGIMVITGAGAPTCTAPAASEYLRSDGASGSHIYISQGAGTWTAISGV